MTLTEEIRDLRKRAGMTQLELGIELGLKPWQASSVVSRWENGRAKPHAPTVKLIRIVCEARIKAKGPV